MAEFCSLKSANFLSELCIFILILLDIYCIFLSKKDRTIKYFKTLFSKFLYSRCYKAKNAIFIFYVNAAQEVPGSSPGSGDGAHFYCGNSSDNLFWTH